MRDALNVVVIEEQINSVNSGEILIRADADTSNEH